jgi:hypothetical protein
MCFGLVALIAITSAGVVATTGCFTFPPFAPEPDPRTPDDIDGDGIPNDEDADIDGDGIVNDEDPDADSDGRFDRSIIVNFPFDHNAFIEPLLPPNHPDFDYQGRLVIPAGHIDISDIIDVNHEGHPLEFLQPKVQEEIAAGESAKTGD